ncbi:MAG: SUMF1/EgtB/PvdO family nonheme iron enzyme [Lentisphaerales bacterium]|nr:SUMF1/EgtB/PvdO family nonheme iron enzyme [Lentisphaerales bacterium]
MKYLLLFLLSVNLYGDKEKNFAEVKKIFEGACLKCHSDSNAAENGGLNMSTFKGMLKGGNVWGAGLTVGNGQASPVYLLTTLPPGTRQESKIMPPDPFRPLEDSAKQVIKKWIDEGAYWPEGVKLKYSPPKFSTIKPTELYKALFVDQVHKVDKFENYESLIPGSKLIYSMVAIPGGTLVREGKDSRESARKISLDPFWMGKYEVTWDEYEGFLFRTFQKKNQPRENLSRVVSHPTPPYVDMSFGMGKKRRPAICLTQLAVKAYCMWLSAKTGHFYRLPTEAEWEYACRAGTKTKYYWGDDINDFNDYEWFYDNTDEIYQEIGTKKPNPFGLHDMLGNVSEWCLDSYREDFGTKSASHNPIALPLKNPALNPAMEAPWPTKIYGRIVKGGNYQDDSTDVTPARRLISSKEWKQLDPQLPKSVWWMTDSLHVGFRIVRSKEIPPLEELHKYWPTDEEIKSIPKR